MQATGQRKRLAAGRKKVNKAIQREKEARAVADLIALMDPSDPFAAARAYLHAKKQIVKLEELVKSAVLHIRGGATAVDNVLAGHALALSSYLKVA